MAESSQVESAEDMDQADWEFAGDGADAAAVVVERRESRHGREVLIGGALFGAGDGPDKLRQLAAVLVFNAVWLEAGQGSAEVPLDETPAYEVISKVRDRYPRRADDAPSEEIVDALVAAGLLVAPERLAEAMEAMPLGLKAALPLDEQIRWALIQITGAAR